MADAQRLAAITIVASGVQVKVVIIGADERDRRLARQSLHVLVAQDPASLPEGPGDPWAAVAPRLPPAGRPRCWRDIATARGPGKHAARIRAGLRAQPAGEAP